MSQTKEGAKKAALTNKTKHGADYYRRIGMEGHKAWIANGRKPTGFAARPELASESGRKGGKAKKSIDKS